MSTFTFDLVSPERQVFSGAVTQVVVPGSEGDFGVLAGHAPVVSTLRPGILTVYGEGTPKKMFVRGGFAEVSATGLTVLAEEALPVEQLDTARIDAEIKMAEEDFADAKDADGRQKASEKLDQLKGLKSALGTLAHGH